MLGLKYFTFLCACSLALGCGSVKSGADGGDTDAAQDPIDAATPDAQTLATVTVRVFEDDALAEDVAVMYHDADGGYLGSVLTNADGEAVIEDMPVGGAVTAPVTPFAGTSSGTQSFLSTIMDVDDGDVLTFGASPVEFGGDGTSVGNLTVNMPDALQNATSYEVHAGCGSASGQAGSQLTPLVRENCVSSEDEVSAIAYAENDSGTRIGYSTALDIALSGTRPDLTGTANLNGWNTDLAEHSLETTNQPASSNAPFGALFNFRAGLKIDEHDTSFEQSTTFRFANGVVDRSVLITQLVFDEAEIFSLLTDGTTEVATASSPKSTSVDLGADLFGPVENVAVAEGDPLGITFDAPDPLACKGNDGPDRLLWVIEAVAEQSSATGIATRDIFWIVLSPGDTASGVTLPELDPAVAQSLWPQSKFLNTSASLSLVADSAVSYDDLRNDERAFSYLDFLPEAADGTRCLLVEGVFLN